MPELCLAPSQEGVFFHEEEHKYFYRGSCEFEAPSSSHIIALSGAKDFDKKHWRSSLMKKGLSEMGAEYFMERVRAIRAETGTELHNYIARHIGGASQAEPYTAPPSEVRLMHQHWFGKVYPRIGKVYIIEQPMIHPGGCYGFTPDLVAEIDGILTLCDWKSNQAEHFSERYKWLASWDPGDEIMRGICEHLAKVDETTGKVREVTARVRDGWQPQQGSYAFGVEAVNGLRVERGINFMVSVDGVREHVWNRADLEQGWLVFAGGLLLHHQRSVLNGGHPIFRSALDALRPLCRTDSML